jgi:hypothetical protein
MTGLYSINTRAVGTVLTAAIYNTDHQNHVDNFIPTMMDDYSINVAQMRSEADPGETGSESLATSMSGELERIRFAIREWKGSTYWFQSARSSFDTLDSPNGFCLLRKSGANIVLSREGGRILFINGKFETIPGAGVTLAPTGLAATTLHYIYAFMNAGVMTLEAVTTVPAADATYGHQIKNGDATRTLVGMIYTPSGATFADTVTQRFVSSWFNRKIRDIIANFTTAAFSTSGADVFISGALVEWINWADEAVRLNAAAQVSAILTGHTVNLGISLDGATTPNAGYIGNLYHTGSSALGAVMNPYSATTGVGYHKSQVVCQTSNANGNTITGAIAGTIRG